MTQKHHQEEISGPLDTVKAASLAENLPRPKRARIQSRKVLKNQEQKFSPKVQPKPTPSQSSTADRNRTFKSKRQQPSTSQNSSQRKGKQIAKKKEKKEWEIQFKSIRNKSQKLNILRNVIGPPRPYPERLKVPTPSKPGRPLLRAYKYKPSDLFHRFIPKGLFAEITRNTNKYAKQQRANDFKIKELL